MVVCCVRRWLEGHKMLSAKVKNKTLKNIGHTVDQGAGHHGGAAGQGKERRNLAETAQRWRKQHPEHKQASNAKGLANGVQPRQGGGRGGGAEVDNARDVPFLGRFRRRCGSERCRSAIGTCT